MNENNLIIPNTTRRRKISFGASPTYFSDSNDNDNETSESLSIESFLYVMCNNKFMNNKVTASLLYGSGFLFFSYIFTLFFVLISYIIQIEESTCSSWSSFFITIYGLISLFYAVNYNFQYYTSTHQQLMAFILLCLSSEIIYVWLTSSLSKLFSNVTNQNKPEIFLFLIMIALYIRFIVKEQSNIISALMALLIVAVYRLFVFLIFPRNHPIFYIQTLVPFISVFFGIFLTDAIDFHLKFNENKENVSIYKNRRSKSISQIHNSLDKFRRSSLPVMLHKKPANLLHSQLSNQLDNVQIQKVRGIIRELMCMPNTPSFILSTLNDISDILNPVVPMDEIQLGSKTVSLSDLEFMASDLPYSATTRNSQETPSILGLVQTTMFTTSASGLPVAGQDSNHRSSGSFKRSSDTCASLSSFKEDDENEKLDNKENIVESIENRCGLNVNNQRPNFHLCNEQVELNFTGMLDKTVPILKNDHCKRRTHLHRHISHEKCNRNSSLMESNLLPLYVSRGIHGLKEVLNSVELDIYDKILDAQILEENILSKIEFPIFKLEELAPENMLSFILYNGFLNSGLFHAFKIPLDKFYNFFHVIEMGYHSSNSYHSRTHATDVFQAVYYLTSQNLPFDIIDTSDESEYEFALKPVMCIEDRLEPLELMALYAAAAMHDYDHPGLTNSYLADTDHPLAVLYNYRSILENHHCAATWSYIIQDKFNFVENLTSNEYVTFRRCVQEDILATDLLHHFEYIRVFNGLVEKGAKEIDWFNASDRMKVCNCIIKMADISGPCRPTEIHLKWTQRIIDEFYHQGDKMRDEGLPIAKYMDRQSPQEENLQISFIENIVSPLCECLFLAKLLPGNIRLSDVEDQSIRRYECPMFDNLTKHQLIWFKKAEEVENLKMLNLLPF